MLLKLRLQPWNTYVGLFALDTARDEEEAPSILNDVEGLALDGLRALHISLNSFWSPGS